MSTSGSTPLVRRVSAALALAPRALALQRNPRSLFALLQELPDHGRGFRVRRHTWPSSRFWTITDFRFRNVSASHVCVWWPKAVWRSAELGVTRLWNHGRNKGWLDLFGLLRVHMVIGVEEGAGLG